MPGRPLSGWLSSTSAGWKGRSGSARRPRWKACRCAFSRAARASRAPPTRSRCSRHKRERSMFNKTSKPQNRIDSLIGATTRIEGNVIFTGGLRVDGMVRGNVASVAEQPGTLVVSAEARIDGEVQAAHIVVNGTINGPVHATETLELQAGSKVKGDVFYKSIEIHQGAVVEGRLVHHPAEMKGVELKLASGG